MVIAPGDFFATYELSPTLKKESYSNIVKIMTYNVTFSLLFLDFAAGHQFKEYS